MERVDGTQARLKHSAIVAHGTGGNPVERVDGTQARLKLVRCHTSRLAETPVERVDGTQARLKLLYLRISLYGCTGWKGWMGLRRD